MFHFYSLYSGSSGNSLFVETSNTKILIDAGESAKKITEALSHLHVDVSDINAIFVTHEHTDHTKGLATLSKKYQIPVFANQETWNAMPSQADKIPEEMKFCYTPNQEMKFEDLSILPFSIPHDAANPCGFNIIHNNEKISIATDLGHINKEILSHLEESKFLLLEANYDPNILKCSRYPYQLKRRIDSPIGHLSNEFAGKTICYLADHGLQTAMLGHLSKENNFPELAYKTVVDTLLENHCEENKVSLSVAMRGSTSKMIDLE